MKHFLVRNWPGLLFVTIGIIGGFLYWKYIGCSSGSCPITSRWYSSAIVGGVMGYFIKDILQDIGKKKI